MTYYEESAGGSPGFPPQPPPGLKGPDQREHLPWRTRLAPVNPCVAPAAAPEDVTGRHRQRRRDADPEQRRRWATGGSKLPPRIERFRTIASTPGLRGPDTPTRRARFGVAPLPLRRPEGAVTYQPRRRPGNRQTTRVARALKGRDKDWPLPQRELKSGTAGIERCSALTGHGSSRSTVPRALPSSLPTDLSRHQHPAARRPPPQQRGVPV